MQHDHREVHNVSPGICTMPDVQMTNHYLVHEAPVVLLNVDSQALHILLKQGLLLPGGKGLVVCPLLRVLT